MSNPFQPLYGSGFSANATAVSARTQLQDPTRTQLCVTNTGMFTAYISIGGPSVTASPSDYPVPPGSQVVLTKSSSSTHIAYMSTSLTSIHVIGGVGL